MEDLSHLSAPLVPSSQSGGNTVHDNPALAMTAPGSPSINDYAQVAKDVLPLPVDSDPPGEDFAHLVSDGGGKSRRPAQAGVKNVNDLGHQGGWVES